MVESVKFYKMLILAHYSLKHIHFLAADFQNNKLVHLISLGYEINEIIIGQYFRVVGYYNNAVDSIYNSLNLVDYIILPW